MKGKQTNAWLLSIAPGNRVAVGELEMQHLIPGRQRFTPIPHTPEFCRNVFIWQGHLIPVFDLHGYLRPEIATRSYTSNQDRHICIVQYRDSHQTVQLGALLLSELPVRHLVTDEQICELPQEFLPFRHIYWSCVQLDGYGVVPILNLSRVFGRMQILYADCPL